MIETLMTYCYFGKPTLGVILLLCVFAYIMFWRHFDKQRADNE